MGGAAGAGHACVGGDHASRRIEAHADLLLSIPEARLELFLHELRDAFGGRGVAISTSDLWRSFRRHRITHKQTFRTAEKGQRRPLV